jgi:hypothetical protein
MTELIALFGLILRGVDVAIKVIDLLRKDKAGKTRNHPHK